MTNFGKYPELKFYAGEDHRRDILDKVEVEDAPCYTLACYDIVFEVEGEHFYCFVSAMNLNEALGLFFRNNPNITYNMVIAHEEV